MASTHWLSDDSLLLQNLLNYSILTLFLLAEDGKIQRVLLYGLIEDTIPDQML